MRPGVWFAEFADAFFPVVVVGIVVVVVADLGELAADDVADLGDETEFADRRESEVLLLSLNKPVEDRDGPLPTAEVKLPLPLPLPLALLPLESEVLLRSRLRRD